MESIEEKGKVLVCLPAYNEEDSIEYMIDHVQKQNLNVVVSDGASTDKTANIARSKGVVVRPRAGHGKGYAVMDCLHYASDMGYEGLVLIDCDKTYNPDEIPLLIAAFEGMDMVVGCRSFSSISPMRRLANRLMTGMISLLYFTRVRDMGSGLRLIRTASFKDKITARGFDVEPQIHSIALRDKYQIAEVPITYSRRPDGKSRPWHLMLVFYRLFLERLGISV